MSKPTAGEKPLSWLDIFTLAYLEGVANGAGRDRQLEKSWHITPKQVERARKSLKKETQDEPPPV